MAANNHIVQDGLATIFAVAVGSLSGAVCGFTKLAVDTGKLELLPNTVISLALLGALFLKIMPGLIKNPKKIDLFLASGFLAAAGTFVATEYAFGSSEIQASQSTQMIMTDSIKTASLQNPNMPKFVIK